MTQKVHFILIEGYLPIRTYVLMVRYVSANKYIVIGRYVSGNKLCHYLLCSDIEPISPLPLLSMFHHTYYFLKQVDVSQVFGHYYSQVHLSVCLYVCLPIHPKKKQENQRFISHAFYSFSFIIFLFLQQLFSSKIQFLNGFYFFSFKPLSPKQPFSSKSLFSEGFFFSF